MKSKHKSSGNSPEAARKVKEQDGAEATEAHDAIMSSKTILQRIEMEQYPQPPKCKICNMLAPCAHSTRDGLRI